MNALVAGTLRRLLFTVGTNLEERAPKHATSGSVGFRLWGVYLAGRIFQNSFTTLVRRTSFTREILHADETLMQVPKGIRKTVVSCPV